MGKFLIALMVLFSTQAFAGFHAYQGTTDLKIFNKLQCDSTYMSCSKVGDKFVISLASNITSLVAPRVAASTTALTAAQCGSTIVNAAAVVQPLPKGAAALIGCRYTFITGHASNFDVNPDDADTILIQTNAAGDAMRNATVGNSITIELLTATTWTPVAIIGTWSDVN